MPSATLATGLKRNSIDRAESDVNIQKANSLSDSFEKASLHILQAPTLFQHKVTEFHDHDPSAPKLPADISNDVAAQVSFLRKLKFHYLEQNAKDKYIKTIVNDDAPIITVDDNEVLRRKNESKKARLKVAKDRLAEQHLDIKTIAPQVEKSYTKARDLVTEAQTLVQQILDTSLSLSRLRAAHPHPRVTISSANATLDAQTEIMASLDTQLSDINSQVEHVKLSVQESAREVERLRVDRSESEKEILRHKAEEEDGRVLGLYDWYTASLSLHRSLASLQAMQCVAENELELTYMMTPLSNPLSNLTVTITLLFLPNTQELAEVHLSGPDPVPNIDIQDVVGSHVQANDVPGLVRSLLARLRATL
ncbi:hypothetical protein BD410DRAFT_830783 [Rickenella mellea]|uniref:Kinetochore protein Sos7 coiled-coil domain-containing protein n=1 Tax=Rickenella mellea TaxID=50990 RepID=A0A4Y7PW90_9AGAM|nr:hypothetical protein BD410DRAFT_830783 [Rickenella mellea]